jgi:hypothetical protein
MRSRCKHGIPRLALTPTPVLAAATVSDFRWAIVKTNSGGEISIMDAADYGQVTIAKSINDQCRGSSWHAS